MRRGYDRLTHDASTRDTRNVFEPTVTRKRKAPSPAMKRTWDGFDAHAFTSPLKLTCWGMVFGALRRLSISPPM